jgi:hypothetical protein
MDLVAAWREAQPVAQLPDVVVEATVCTPAPVAWRLYSRRLDRELWVARDGAAASALDQDGVRGGLPVVLAVDLERLRTFDGGRLHDLLDALAVFPGSRITDPDNRKDHEG